jgi:hypothetical protein
MPHLERIFPDSKSGDGYNAAPLMEEPPHVRGPTIFTRFLFKCLESKTCSNRSRLIIFESSQVNGRDGNGGHYTSCGP